MEHTIAVRGNNNSLRAKAGIQNKLEKYLALKLIDEIFAKPEG